MILFQSFVQYVYRLAIIHFLHFSLLFAILYNIQPTAIACNLYMSEKEVFLCLIYEKDISSKLMLFFEKSKYLFRRHLRVISYLNVILYWYYDYILSEKIMKA